MREVTRTTSKSLYPYNSNAQLCCLSCGSPKRVSTERGGWFCRECLERSRMKNLDPIYDDLGGAG